jgi:glutamyl-tRNA synthetase
MPKFAHLALLLSPNGGKLSKRQADKYGIPVFPNDWLDEESGDTWRGYKSLGYFPEALVNFLALLGWHPGGEQELMTMDELIAAFSLERAHHAGAKVDMAKLNSFQQHYLRLKSPEELGALLRPLVDAAGLPYPDQHYLDQVMAMMRERVTFVKDVIADAPYFFHAPAEYNEKMARKNWKADNREALSSFSDALQKLGDWNNQAIDDLFHSFLEEKGLGAGKLMAPLRLALTGLPSGPGCFEIAAALGREETISRIQRALANLAVVA